MSALFSSHANRARLALLGLALGLVAACGQPDGAVTRADPYDPHEATNRKMHEFNRAVDRALLRPAGKGYSNAIPDDIEAAIGRVAFNLSIPSAVVNNILQGNMRGAITDTARFVVNTTVGVAGILDPATEINMPAATDADFGQTLYVWGVPEGAYAEVPFLGPGTNRSMAGKVVDIFTNPLSYVLPSPESYYGTAASLGARLSDRGQRSDTIDSILYESADSYAQVRSIYLQNRRFKLEQGPGGTSVESNESVYDDLYGGVSE